MDVSKLTTQNTNQATAGVSTPLRGQEVFHTRESLHDSKPVAIPANEATYGVASDEERQARMEHATQAIIRDIYAVSDSKFTIFKDASGQYITRIVSLRDGRVTYIPEPEAVSYLSHRQTAPAGMALDA